MPRWMISTDSYCLSRVVNGVPESFTIPYGRVINAPDWVWLAALTPPGLPGVAEYWPDSVLPSWMFSPTTKPSTPQYGPQTGSEPRYQVLDE